MKTFVPSAHFTGYPFGKPVEFRTGQESIPVPDEYVQLMREKGYVDLTAQRAPATIPAPTPAAAKKFAKATSSRRPGKASRQSSQD